MTHAERLAKIEKKINGAPIYYEITEDVYYLLTQVRTLQARNEKLREALKDAVDSWGDYSPAPGNSKAYKALVNARKALADEGEE